MWPIWVVYEKPTDFPNTPFVLREHHLEKGKLLPDSKTWLGTSLGRIRRYIPKGKTRKAPSKKDPPHIVEWWF